MKILAFTDLHGSKKLLKGVISKSKKADLIICAGDFSIFGNEKEKIIKELDKIRKPILFIHGNHEDEHKTRIACSKTKNISFIHGKKHIFGNYVFLGWGGGGFSIRDMEFERVSKKWRFDKGNIIILVAHAPPYNTRLDKIYGQPAGNKSIRKFIEKIKPKLVICGHLHENDGKVDKINKTLIVNPSSEGRIMEI